MYYDYRESLKTVPGHRLLAIRHGSKGQVLSWKIVVEEDNTIDLILYQLDTKATYYFVA